MKLLFAGAALLALTLPAFAGDSIAPISGATKCTPYAEALKDISAAGGHLLGDYAAPFVRNGRILYYEYEGVVVATGIARNHACVYLSPAIIGRLDIDPREL